MTDEAEDPTATPSGRIALVTGASRGIGREIAEQLASAGMRVAVCARGDCSELADTIGGLAVRCDVADPDSVDAAFGAVEEHFGGKVGVLVNNAGINRDGLLLAMSVADMSNVIATDLTGAMITSKRALKGMLRAKWGRIVNIGSVAGLAGNPGQTNYSAAKAGLVGFTKALAREIASRNITVNLVAPGFVDTEMVDELPENVRQAAIESIPMGRVGTPAEIASAVRFLTSDDASYVTGSVLKVDGGMV